MQGDRATLADNIRADADVLRIAADAVADAAEAVTAGEPFNATAQALTRASLNAVVSALGLARKSGALETLADFEGDNG